MLGVKQNLLLSQMPYWMLGLKLTLCSFSIWIVLRRKGADSARWHFGIIAQRAKEVFERHGIDAHRYGFLCFDSWDNVYEEDANGSRKLITPAGSRYGIRYEEVLILEAALMRRTIKRMQEALASLPK